jgi:RimJ/RimL family protein N-acetyltransferase
MGIKPMKTPFIVGTQIYLRPLEREDLNERYLGWLNDPEVNRYLESGIFPSTKDTLEEFYEQATKSPDQVILAIIDKETDQHIGNVKLGPINWVHRKATFGILIGDKQLWGRGIGTEATRLMVGYGFTRLNLNRIELGVCAEHEAAVRCYEAVGFRVEGRFRESLFHEGQYKDGLWMGLLRSEYGDSEGDATK